ncbi:hypothetical protein JRQ81_014351 [Phrynocephalus forsythii]|uniref:Uncharacterized protein n=1 Tax=Phrynocephalus forsythii TaxID=171643 RepID=A0A9Q0XXH2_9SAUR|nr:hypothetical protein JRQ81_014351 [Phrynocephalus forsythii]
MHRRRNTGYLPVSLVLRRCICEFTLPTHPSPLSITCLVVFLSHTAADHWGTEERSTGREEHARCKVGGPISASLRLPVIFARAHLTHCVNSQMHLRRTKLTDKNMAAYAVRAETGISSISSLTVSRAFSFWLKVQSMGTDRLPKLCLIEQANSVTPNSWARQIGIIIAHFGLSTQSLLVSGQQAKITFKQIALDVSAQQDMELLSKNRTLIWLSKNKLVFKCEKYLTISLPYSLRRRYTRLRFEFLAFMNKFGHFHNLPYNERTCICSAPAIEDIAHILIDCELYTALRQSYLSKMMAKIAHWDVNFQLAFLLQSSNMQVVHGVANFICKTARVRSSYIDQIGIYCRGNADS